MLVATIIIQMTIRAMSEVQLLKSVSTNNSAFVDSGPQSFFMIYYPTLYRYSHSAFTGPVILPRTFARLADGFTARESSPN